jgi:cytochrome b561
LPTTPTNRDLPANGNNLMEQKSFTLVHRILHWLIAFTFLFILLTVFLRMYWLNRNHTASIIMAQLTDMGVHISSDQAVKIGKAIRKPMWEWHIYAGYFLIGLYIIRLVVMKVQGSVFANPFIKNLSSKKRFKSAVYLSFYILLGITLISGGYIELADRKWELARQVMKAIHVQALYFALAFITLHFAGLVLAELWNEKGIVSKMIHGK